MSRDSDEPWIDLSLHYSFGVLNLGRERDVPNGLHVLQISHDSPPFEGGSISDEELRIELLRAADRLTIAEARDGSRVHILDVQGIALVLRIPIQRVVEQILRLASWGELAKGRSGHFQLRDGSVKITREGLERLETSKTVRIRPEHVSNVLVGAVIPSSKPEPTDKTRRCFVIMPFSESAAATEAGWTAVFDKVIKPAVELADPRYTCFRIAEPRGSIVKGIVEKLYDSDIVVADITDNKANVFYELGARHVFRKSGTLLIRQGAPSDSPFDVTVYWIQPYDPTDAESVTQLSNWFRKATDDIDKKPGKSDSPVHDHLSDQLWFAGPGIHGLAPPNPHVAKLAVYQDGKELVIENVGEIALERVAFETDPPDPAGWDFFIEQGVNAGVPLAPGEATRILMTRSMSGGPIAIRVNAFGHAPDGSLVEAFQRLT